MKINVLAVVFVQQNVNFSENEKLSQKKHKEYMKKKKQEKKEAK